ncbi:MAG: hypothetical protein WEF51_03655 [Chloroflexota bacterium]
MSRLALVFAAALVLAGCGAATSPSASPSPSAELPLDPAVLGLSCGGSDVFHPSLLAVPGQAQDDPDPAAAALRAEIVGSTEELVLPRTGWVRVAQLADRVQFVAPDGEGDGWLVVGFLQRDGRWMLDLKGECQPEVELPAGVGRAEWRLDPAFPPPAIGDRQIHVLINELACASGQSPEGRVLPPMIAPSQTAMTIVILVTGRPGGQDCPGNPDFAMVADLPEPLGERPLLDGAVFPPRDVTRPSSG